MKKVITLFLFFFFCMNLFSQEEVTFNFSRKIVDDVPVKIKLYVNGVEVTKLKDGESYVYKAVLDVSKPVTVLAKNGAIKQELSFKLSPENIVNMETNLSFSGKRIGLYLGLLSGGAPVPGTGMIAGIKPNRSNLSLLYTSTRQLPSDTIRMIWLEKGGRILAGSYVGSVNFLYLKEPGMKMTGTGGQLTGTVTSLNFKIPEYKPGIQTWNSGVLGYSVGFQMFGSKITVEGLDHPMTSFSANYTISVNGGYTLGVGKFKSETKWKGAAFELTYRPSVVIALPLEEGSKFSASLNLMGFGFDINFNNFTSNASKLAPRAQSKFTVFFLPPVKQMPLIINVGYGLVFYRKPIKR